MCHNVLMFTHSSTGYQYTAICSIKHLVNDEITNTVSSYINHISAVSPDMATTDNTLHHKGLKGNERKSAVKHLLTVCYSLVTTALSCANRLGQGVTDYSRVQLVTDC